MFRYAFVPKSQSHGDFVSTIVGITVSLAVIMTALLAARFYSRGVLRRMLGWDDWIMVLAWSFAISYSAIVVSCMVPYGLGRHEEDMIYPDNNDNNVPWVQMWNRFNKANQLLFVVGTRLTKISLCMTYLRLFPGSAANKWFCRAVIAYCALEGIAYFFTWLFQCIPISDFWYQDYPANPRHNCFHDRWQGFIEVLSTTATNMIVFLWPARFLWHLKLSHKQRFKLICLFCLGCCISIVSLVRLWRSYLKFVADQNHLWNFSIVILLAVADLNLGVICGCLPFCHFILAAIVSRVAKQKKGPGGSGRPHALPRFHAFTAPAARHGMQRMSDTFSDVERTADHPITAPYNATGPSRWTPPAIAPRVLQHPPDIDFDAALMSMTTDDSRLKGSDCPPLASHQLRRSPC